MLPLELENLTLFRVASERQNIQHEIVKREKSSEKQEKFHFFPWVKFIDFFLTAIQLNTMFTLRNTARHRARQETHLPALYFRGGGNYFF